MTAKDIRSYLHLAAWHGIACLFIVSCGGATPSGGTIDGAKAGDLARNEDSTTATDPNGPGDVVGLKDDTSGVHIYTRRFRRRESDACTNPPGGPIDKVIERANNVPFWTYIGAVAAELVSFKAGDPGEVSGNPVDDTPQLVFQGLTIADDFQPVVSGEDGEKNFDAGTGGTITLRLSDNQVIYADGRAATGVMSTTATDPKIALDGSEIILFEDAELSGYTVTVHGPTQEVSFAVEDHQNDVNEGDYGDDTMLAIDLDTLAGWSDQHVERITITDDGIDQGAWGLCAQASIDTSLELDAVAIRNDVIGPVR